MARTSTTTNRQRRAFGRVKLRDSGRYTASYLHHGVRHRAPASFPTKESAASWLQQEQDLIDLDHRNPGKNIWTPPAERLAEAKAEAAKARGVTVAEFAERWLRDHPLTRRGRDSYQSSFDRRLYGTALAEMPIAEVTVGDVREWFGAMDPEKPTARARTYEAVSSMFSAAVDDGLLTANPCRIKNAAKVRRARPVVHIESTEVGKLAEKMPDDLGAAVLLAAWCGLRFGEVIALDRADLAADGSVVNVSKGYVRRGGVSEISAPKSGRSRAVVTPPHIRAALVEHLSQHVATGPESPVFTDADGNRITEGKFSPSWHAARDAIGRPTLRFHDLRHHAGMVAATAGATIAESMARLGHSSPTMALHYAEVAAGRDALLADRIAALAGHTDNPA